MLQEDFAENFAIHQQNEIMSAHWISEEVTIFTTIISRNVVMAVIKMERDIDPLATETSENNGLEYKKPLSEEENILDLHWTEIKAESEDHSYNLTSEMNLEETAVPIKSVMVKYEPGMPTTDATK
ncbi:uncharacterized protein [Periplaneta americana]|uniref:uncharacterized protein isoform X9 n=1 Tax=Periplaneta americana TaxID=6978 RepID=UPI0037E70CF5